ncbi:hypothetical protein CFC21_090582 [Triticum aestivum]|uniref:Major facilitator superfamily (MFS) profile domain-containing protein n=2 Tax=Triticum aestivum TaxID=4565 RepID=A0A9R1MS92_WHEAT|nr:monosaccharide-sensing protein 2-like [Triticum aestivum]KAF7087387.1 hypothetical protein CFC21_090582 [Triticum aestivum]
MRGAALVALAAALGNMLQGWDNATIAGSLLYIKRDFGLHGQPALQGLVVATSLIGATLITTFSGPLSDRVGRRPMLVASSLLYALAGLLMLWSPTVGVLLLARLVDGFAVGLAVTLVPVYISETAPPEVRGLLSTLPQLTGSTGMFLAYCMVFAMTLAPSPNWRVMMGVLVLPSLVYVAVAVLFLPESPRWLVSKGRMKEARTVLRMLRGREDVDGEMALLAEGLGAGGDTAIEEYIVGPAPEEDDQADQAGAAIRLYGPERGMSWVAQPVPLGGQGSMLSTGMSRQGSLLGSIAGLSRMGSMLDHLQDPVVALLGGLHDMKPAADGNGNTLFTNFGSMLSAHGGMDWDEENAAPSDDDDNIAAGAGEDDVEDGGLKAPLLDMRGQSSMTGSGIGMGQSQTTSTMGIGGGWQLAWKWTEGVAPDGTRQSAVQRMYLHEEPGGDGQHVHAAALVNQSALYSTTNDNLQPDDAITPMGPAMVHPASSPAAEKPRWRDLLEPGVRHALVCGVAIQILQQFSGISGILYYTPQILDQAGVSVLLSNLGLTSDSAAILISGLTTLLMLPAIAVAMRLMDVAGRRSLLLWTIPVLIVSLVSLVTADVLPLATTLHAAVSTTSIIVYICTFVMGFGPIPGILCSEIFPTRVRGMCIAICSLAFWLSNIAVTYSMPVMLDYLGLTGVFSIYAAVCCVALAFVALRVPETKGLPLEVIAEFFNVASKGMPKLDHDE